MKTVLIIFLLSLTFNSYAQTGRIKGTIKNESEERLPYTTVSLIRDSLPVNGVISDSEGNFELKGINYGNYLLSVSLLGYQNYTNSVRVSGDVDFGDILLKEEATQIEEVVVQGRLPEIRRGMDRYIVNTENSVILKNKNALQALNYMPGVMIAQNNTITLNGKDNVVVMINGRKMNMKSQDINSFLQGLSGDDLQRIEIIDSPGAQFDSEGQGGVIDIYLRKSAWQGWSGSVNGSISQAHYTGGSVGQTLNYTYKKWSFHESVNFTQWKSRTEMDEEMRYEADNLYRNTSDFSRKQGPSFNYRLGARYDINSQHIIGVEAYGNYRKTDGYQSSLVKTESAGTDAYGSLISDSRNESRNLSVSLDYTYHIGSRGHDLRALVDYTRTNQDHNSLYDLDEDNILEKKHHKNSNDFDILTGQIDYMRPLGKKLKLTAGIKYSQIESVIDENMKNYVNGNWTNDADYTYKYDYKERLGAAYLILNYSFGRFEGNVGVRGEYCGDNISNSKREGSDFFPSGLLKYSPHKNLYFSLYYGRRINRPPYRSLVPYVYFVSPYSIYKGNPSLVPSIVNSHSFTVGYRRYSIAFSYDRISDNIYFLSEYDEGQDVTVSRNENIYKGQLFNINLVLPLKLTPWWESFNNLSFRHKKFDDKHFLLHTNRSVFMIRSGNTFSLPYNFDLEISLLVMTKSVAGPMIVQRGGISVDAGISKQVWKNRIRLSFSAEDLNGFLNGLRSETYYNGMRTKSSDFMDSRKFILSARYNFNSGRKINHQLNRTSNRDEKSRIEEK